MDYFIYAKVLGFDIQTFLDRLAIDQFILVMIFLAMFVLFLWAMYKVERQLNDEGESLFYPWRVPRTKAEA